MRHFKSAPLLDRSNEKMKGWPGGGCFHPDGTYTPTFRPCKPGETPTVIVESGPTQTIYCKYCHEDVLGLPMLECEYSTRMVICSACGSGLTPSLNPDGTEFPTDEQLASVRRESRRD